MTSRKSAISLPGAMFQDAKRFGKIVTVLSKYGFGVLFGDRTRNHDTELLESLRNNPATTAEKVRLAIAELGTTYIKFGQMLSTRSDLLPAAFITELSKLQDNTPELPFDTVEQILNDHYGDWHTYFSFIEPKPLGSASIAQVHHALTTDGHAVVIKVQRPGLLPLIRSDVDILRTLARMLDHLIEEISYFNLPDLVDEFERTIVDELDFSRERSNIEHFIARYGDRPMFEFPTPYTELSCANILVMQELEGKKITTIEPNTEIAHNMAQALLGITFDMIFKDGIFHGDPHPGNIFATPDNRIAVLDFGAVGSFSPRQRNLLMRLILGASLGDCGMMARTLMSLGHPTKRVVISDLENDISEILQRHLKQSLNKIDVAAFAHDFVSAGQKYAIQIPSEFSCAVRALLGIEGIIQYLEPELDVMQTLSGYAHKLLQDAFGQDALKLNLLQLGLNTADLAKTLPAQFIQLMQDLEYDGIAVRVQSATGDRISDAINAAATRLCLTLMLILLTVCIYMTDHFTLLMVTAAADLLWCFFLIHWHITARATKPKFRVTPFVTRWQRRKKWF